MPSPASIVAFATTAFALIVVPGPSVLFVISRGVALGRRAALATVVGNAAGAYLQALVVAVGMAPLITSSQTVFTAIRLAGAAYLIWLGISAVRHRTTLTAALDSVQQHRTPAAIAREGFFVGLGNPKATVFFASILPQFVATERGAVPLQMMLLGAVFVAIALLSDGMWALVSGTARAWLARSPRRLRALGGTGGLVMIGLGVRLAVTGPSRAD